MRTAHERTDARLDQIETFAAVADLGGFAAAGRALGRDASVIARRIDALEARLGVRLLTRSTRRIALTAVGEVYLRRMREVLSDLSAAEAEAIDGAASPRGLLRMSMPLVFARHWVVPWLPAFLEKYPNIEVELHHADRYIDLIGEGFDLAIRLGELPDSSLVARRLARYDTVLCASPAYLAANGTPQRIEDLEQHRCLGVTLPHLWPEWRLRRGDERRTVRVGGQLRFDDGGTMVLAAVHGAGIVVASQWSSGWELADGRLIRVLPDWRYDQEGAVQIVMPQGRDVPARTRLFIDRLIEVFTPVPPWAELSRTG